MNLYADCSEINDNKKCLNTNEREIFNLVNTHRLFMGLLPFKLSMEATIEARAHTKFMAYTLRGLTYDGFSERIDRIEACMNQGISRSAENIAYNLTALRAQEALLNSQGHRRNIEGDYTHIGLGVYIDEGSGTNWDRLYLTEIFIKSREIYDSNTAQLLI